MSPTLVVMAAGLGTRYGRLKQLDPLGPSGETLLEYALFDARRAGFARVVLIIREEIEAELRSAVLERLDPTIEVEVVHQRLDDLPPGFVPPPGRRAPWGTGHAVRSARAAIDGPFAVINADDFYGAEAFELMGDHLRSLEAGVTDAFAMVGYRLDRTLSPNGPVSRALCSVDDDGWLTEVTEVTRIQRSGARITAERDGQQVSLGDTDLVSMNFWGFAPSFLELAEAELRDFLEHHLADLDAEFLTPSVVGALVSRGLVRVSPMLSNDSWFGVTHPEDRPGVVAALQQLVHDGHYPAQLWS